MIFYLFRLSNVSSVSRDHIARYNIIRWLSLLFLAGLFFYSAAFVFLVQYLTFQDQGLRLRNLNKQSEHLQQCVVTSGRSAKMDGMRTTFPSKFGDEDRSCHFRSSHPESRGVKGSQEKQTLILLTSSLVRISAVVLPYVSPSWNFFIGQYPQ